MGDRLSCTYVEHQKSILSALFVALLFFTASCSKKLEPASESIGPAKLSAGSWVPSITGAGSSNTKGSVTITTTPITLSGKPMVRLNEAWSGKEFSVDLGTYSASDFGTNGSMTLIAEVLNYPTSGGAYAVMTSFNVNDSNGATVDEFINTNATCTSSGMYTCSGGSCVSNGCSIGSPSSFVNRNDWDQHQIPPFGYITTNSFPRCDASIGTWSTCPVDLGTLRSGVYTAKYVLLSDSGSAISQTVGLKITKIVKRDNTARGNSAATNGAIDLNVILVGTSTINDSHSAKGAQNLNLLYGEVHNIMKANSGVGLGTVKVFEWADADGGSQYAQVDYSDVGTMLAAGSAGINLIDPTLEGKAINVFMVQDIENGSPSSTILGLSGGILGPMTNGTQTSGLVFATDILNSGASLSAFNPSCTLSSCPRNNQQDDFIEMGATIAHELGHYLSLNHPSERKYSSSAQRHDQLSDTPECTDTVGPSQYMSQKQCYVTTCKSDCDTEGGGLYYTAGGAKTTNYCPLSTSCQFNHVMWYTTKNRYQASVGAAWKEDGNQISEQSSALVQWNPFVR